MSGHNKWTQIKRKKEKTDAQKSKIFGKFARLISQEVKRSNGNINSPSVKAVIDRARSFNMPNDNIERALKKGVSENINELESIIYESYGPGGVAMLIEVLTDNKNRAAQEIKSTLNTHKLSLAAPGSAMWAFQKENGVWKPNNTIPLSEEDALRLADICEELENLDDVQEVFTNAE
jgi:YebC/PmpR family DNA-binding regulatory protein